MKKDIIFQSFRAVSGCALLITIAVFWFSSSSLSAVQTHTSARSQDAARFGRASKPVAPELTAFIELQVGPHPLIEHTYYGQMNIHRAHVIMLAEQNIITMEDAAQILLGLKKIKEAASKDPRLIDYMRTETALINEVGSIGGKMHIGRSRNDLGGAMNRIYYRDQINRMTGVLINFQKTLVEKAEQNKYTVMTVYTHRKQAQPVTLAHYLLALVESTGKSIQRLEGLYTRTNLNVMGSAASASTGWPLDRSRTMNLLGFDGLVVNSIEGVAGWDHIAEFAAVISIHMSSMARLASEIHIWSRDESAMIDLDESFAGTSSIMPQKKNPISLEKVKQSSSEILGALVGILSSLNSAEYQHTRMRMPLAPRYIELAIGATEVMAGVTRTMKPEKERMLKFATEGFSTMAELADTIVRKTDLSFREAHDIVAHVVMNAIAAGKTANHITLEMVQEAAKESHGGKLNINREEIRAAINPSDNVAIRSLPGGPSPVSVRKMIDDFSAEIRDEEVRLDKRLRKLAVAAAKLDQAEHMIIATAKQKQ